MLHSEKQEYEAMKGFELVMQSFNTLHLNRSDNGGRMLNISNLRCSVQNHERARLEILLRFSKYSIQELKKIFTAIDVELEAVNILEKLNQTKALT